MNAIEQKHRSLWLCGLDQDMHEKTCGYWYTLTSYGGTPVTAFRTYAGLCRYFRHHKLALPDNVPAQGVYFSARIEGEAIDVMHLSTESFAAIDGRDTWRMNNGSYTPAKIDSTGKVHYMNPNCKQPILDWRIGEEMCDRGLDMPNAVTIRG